MPSTSRTKSQNHGSTTSDNVRPARRIDTFRGYNKASRTKQMSETLCVASSILAMSKAGVDGSEEYVQVRTNDVLCGRGGQTNIHSGNRLFRRVVDCNRRLYQETDNTFRKQCLVSSIVFAIERMGGRFLQKKGKEKWIHAHPEFAIRKTAQALREKGNLTPIPAILFNNSGSHPQHHFIQKSPPQPLQQHRQQHHQQKKQHHHHHHQQQPSVLNPASCAANTQALIDAMQILEQQKNLKTGAKNAQQNPHQIKREDAMIISNTDRPTRPENLGTQPAAVPSHGRVADAAQVLSLLASSKPSTATSKGEEKDTNKRRRVE